MATRLKDSNIRKKRKEGGKYEKHVKVGNKTKPNTKYIYKKKVEEDNGEENG